MAAPSTERTNALLDRTKSLQAEILALVVYGFRVFRMRIIRGKWLRIRYRCHGAETRKRLLQCLSHFSFQETLFGLDLPESRQAPFQESHLGIGEWPGEGNLQHPQIRKRFQLSVEAREISGFVRVESELCQIG